MGFSGLMVLAVWSGLLTVLFSPQSFHARPHTLPSAAPPPNPHRRRHHPQLLIGNEALERRVQGWVLVFPFL